MSCINQPGIVDVVSCRPLAVHARAKEVLAATDPDNQTFRVFGEKILRENFKMEVYNKFGSLVYQTDSFDEANLNGWDGTNQRTGKQEPSGLYYYVVVLTRINGDIEERTGPFYLQR